MRRRKEEEWQNTAKGHIAPCLRCVSLLTWSAACSFISLAVRSRRRKEEEERERIAQMEEAALQAEEKYSGLADEAEQKTKKLKKLWKKFQEVRGRRKGWEGKGRGGQGKTATSMSMPV